jgi:hypothetical protein
MSDRGKPGDAISATIRGDVSGQIAVGMNNALNQTVNAARPAVTEADLTALWQALADLRIKVASEAPPEKKAAALERVDELQEAVTTERPDLTTMEYVKNWFAKHMPTLAGAVVSVVVHPVVGRLVEAAGDVLVAEFHRRFAEA